ncbi:MAG: methionyl-tRNA formyltransferase [Nevskiales bacterium]
MKLVFAGTPDFALPALAICAAAPHEMLAVYTQPDRPAGRGRRLTASPVKRRALELAVPVHQSPTLKSPEAQAQLRALAPELIVVVAYGLMLPQAVLDIPKHGCVNVHASLLPRWRGAAPIARAILAGDSETGISIMQMDAGLDTGPILLTRTCAIRVDDSAATLHDRLAALGAEALTEALTHIASGRSKSRPQPESGASYAHKLDKREAQLDWTRTAEQLARQVRAFNPTPIASAGLNGETLRVWQAQAITGSAAATPGSVIRAGAAGIEVATGDGVLRITQLQWPGGRVLSAAEAANGRALVGQRFN